MAARTLEEVEKQFAEAAELWLTMEETEFPQTLREAIDSGWKVKLGLEANAATAALDLAQLGALAAYDPEQSHGDSKRLVKISAAMDALAELEEELVGEYVLSSLSVSFNVGRGILHFVRGVLSELEKLLVALVTWEWEEFQYERIVLRHLSLLLPALSLKNGAVQTAKAMRIREKVAERLRARALFQGNQKRLYRRKVTWTKGP
jgi:hypothetical protein